MGQDLTRWTIRLALAAYVAVLVSRIRTKSVSTRLTLTPADACADDKARRDWLQRGLWTVGCCLAWAHVATAFAVYHHWSHDEAYIHTAQETAATIGIDWGGGIYFNYLFMLLWNGDVVWWWAFPAAYRARSGVYSGFLDAYLAFIAFNATVIFGHGTVRYFGIAATLGLVWLAWSGRSRGNSSPQ